MIHVLATITLVKGKRADWLTLFKSNMPAVLAEAGCIEYAPALDLVSGLASQAPTDGDQVVVIEKWESVEHLKAHLAAPHMVAYREKAKELVTGVHLRVLGPA